MIFHSMTNDEVLKEFKKLIKQSTDSKSHRVNLFLIADRFESLMNEHYQMEQNLTEMTNRAEIAEFKI